MFQWLRKRETVPILASPNMGVTTHAVLLTAPGVAMMRKKFVQFSDKPLVKVSPISPFTKANTAMTRVIYEDGTASRWNPYTEGRKRVYAVETCCVDLNGRVRHAQLRIG